MLHREEFHQNGFTNFSRFIDDATIALLTRIAEEEYALHIPLIGAPKERGTPDHHPLMMDMLGLKRPELYRLLTSPRMIEVAQMLLGEEVFLFNDQFIVKKPGSSVAYPWHTDNFYGSGYGLLEAALDRSYRSISCAWCLTDCDLENGCVIALPKSKADLSELRNGCPDPKRTEAELQSESIPLIASRGDLIVWDGNLLHQSAPNRSEATRTLWVTVYNTRPVDTGGRYYSEKLA